ncbi:MAG: hypothetical protein P9X24_00780 [Candidatus Hatepunaea meridiana]|nr:hypothetical protein [Candidatus Hatepunaea meridiana]
MKKTVFTVQIWCAAAFIGSMLLLSCASVKQQSDPIPELIEGVKMVIITTINANQFFKEDYKQDALSFVMLEKMDYLMIDPYTKKIFAFTLTLKDGKLVTITATTTEESPVGSGKKVIYDVNSQNWSGDLVELYRSQK